MRTTATPAAIRPGTVPAWATARPAIRATRAPIRPASRHRIFQRRGEGDNHGEAPGESVVMKATINGVGRPAGGVRDAL